MLLPVSIRITPVEPLEELVHGGEVLGPDHAGHVGSLVGGQHVEVRVALGADEGAEVTDPGLVDVAELLEVLEQLAGGVAVGAAGAADAEGAAGLVVVPRDHAATADGAEGVAGREHAGRLGRAALGVEERDRARAVEVALDGAAGPSRRRSSAGPIFGAIAPPLHLRTLPRQPQVAGPTSICSAATVEEVGRGHESAYAFALGLLAAVGSGGAAATGAAATGGVVVGGR